VTPRRGDVYWVNLDPTIGSELKKTRPAVVVSNDSMNKFAARLIMMPLTSNVEKCFPGEVVIKLKGKKARALGDQIRSVDQSRLGRKVGKLSAVELQAIDEALRITLAL
jgi:mRNA interferase MazF